MRPRLLCCLVSLAAMPLVHVVPVLRANARFQPVYVADVAAAAVTALADPARFGGKTFELGGPDVITMGALVRWIAKEIGRDPAFVDVPDSLGGMIADTEEDFGEPCLRIDIVEI